MTIRVTKSFKFDSAHYLPKYDGKCHELHGHTYHLDVTVEGNIIEDDKSPKQGMIVDFTDVKRIVNTLIVDKFDHKLLNNFYANPTAEIMVVDIFSKLDRAFSAEGMTLYSCRLWETETSYAEVIR